MLVPETGTAEFHPKPPTQAWDENPLLVTATSFNVGKGGWIISDP